MPGMANLQRYSTHPAGYADIATACAVKPKRLKNQLSAFTSPAVRRRYSVPKLMHPPAEGHNSITVYLFFGGKVYKGILGAT